MSDRLEDYDYHLPPERIAQTPVEPRDASRLLVARRNSDVLEHRVFHEIPMYFRRGDVLVVNTSRVRAARIHAQKETGGRVELLILKPLADDVWETLVHPGRRVPPGTRLLVDGGLVADVLDRTESGGRLVRFSGAASLDDVLATAGEVPLPPYIHERLEDPERYQTVYSDALGSAAAPTAGLHFTPELLRQLRGMGVRIAEVTLHIGLDTFRPVKAENLDDHTMHAEWFEVSEKDAEIINEARGRVFAVGTTTVRALESAARDGRVRPGARQTRLFLRPGARFEIVDALITNFHLPKSTLLVLVSAFAGRERMLRAYRVAVEEGYRFFSFGDAMLILDDDREVA